jgi:hypothetical protein
MIEDVNTQSNAYREDMLRDFDFRMADIENILYEMEQRGDVFFEDTFRLARIMDLLNKSRIQRSFETTVVADVPQQIEQKVNELIDWIVEANLRQWQAVHDHLAKRRQEHHARIVGDSAIGTFHYDRESLIDAVGQASRRAIDSFDKDNQSRLIAESAQEAVAASAAIEIGAIGLGTLITVLASTVAADVTGILLASLIAAVGLFVIPARRRQAKIEMRQKVAELRGKLATSLRKQFEHEIQHSLKEIEQAIAPYTRFIRTENNKLSETEQRLAEIKNAIDGLEERITAL